MKISKIILFFVSFILSFLLFTKDTFAVIYDYDISKFVFKPVSSDKLLNWVPTDFQKFTYKDPYLKTRAIVWPGTITTKAITYLTDYHNPDDNSKNKSAYNFSSIMPFFAIVNPKYLDSKAKIGIPVTISTQDRSSKYIYITPDQDEYWNTCLYVETESWKEKSQLRNTCFSNFYSQEPFLMIFSLNHFYKFKNQSGIFLYKSYVQEDSPNYTTLHYTLTRRAGKAPWEKEEPISLYKTDSVKFDISELGYDFAGYPLRMWYKDERYNADVCDKNIFKHWCGLIQTKDYSDFMRQWGQRFIQFYSYDIKEYPGKAFDNAGGYIYSYDPKEAKAQFYQFFPVKSSHFLDQFAPFIVEQVYGEPIKKPDGNLYDFTPWENNWTGSLNEKWPFKIPKFNMQKPEMPTCSFLESFLGLSCLAEWVNYGFSMIVWIITKVIDSVIDFLNYMIEFNFNFFNAFLDIFKKFIIWMFDTAKNFIWPYIQPFWNDYLKPVWDFFYGFFKPLWEVATMKTDFQTFFWGSQSYICQKSSWFYIDTETPPAMRPSELLGFFFYLANPIPPQDSAEICTNIWVKRLNYWRSTIIDTIVFLFFITAGLWFLFYIVRE